MASTPRNVGHTTKKITDNQSQRQVYTRDSVVAEIYKINEEPICLTLQIKKYLEDLIRKAQMVSSSLVPNLQELQSLIRQSDRINSESLNKLNIELQQNKKAVLRFKSSEKLLQSISDVLKLIAKDSTDAYFQNLYNEYSSLLRKLQKTHSNISLNSDTFVQMNRQLIRQLKNEQQLRMKAQQGLDLICESMRQSLVIKQGRIKELEKIVKASKTELLAQNSQNQSNLKLLHQQTMKIASLEQELRQIGETSLIVQIEPTTSTTLADSRTAKIIKGSQICSPKNNQITSELGMTQLSKSKSRLPPMPPLSPSSVEQRKRSGNSSIVDQQSESMMRLLLVQACSLQAYLKPHRQQVKQHRE